MNADRESVSAETCRFASGWYIRAGLGSLRRRSGQGAVLCYLAAAAGVCLFYREQPQLVQTLFRITGPLLSAMGAQLLLYLLGRPVGAGISTTLCSRRGSAMGRRRHPFCWSGAKPARILRS